MCGRYVLATEQTQLMEQFNLIESNIELTARYNIAPTQPVAVVLNQFPKTLNMAQWGLIPSWAKDAKMSANMINARSETLMEKPSFRNLFKNRRCLVFANGFYEWRINEDGSKTPFYISLTSGKVFAMAGLWDVWKSPDGGEKRTCTVITTHANEALASLHERMAVILQPGSEHRWLEGTSPELGALLKPYPSELMKTYEVSKKVNSVRNDGPALIEPATPSLYQAGLF